MLLLFPTGFVHRLLFVLSGGLTLSFLAALWASSRKPLENVLMIPQPGKPVQRPSMPEKEERGESGGLFFSHCWSKSCGFVQIPPLVLLNYSSETKVQPGLGTEKIQRRRREGSKPFLSRFFSFFSGFPAPGTLPRDAIMIMTVLNKEMAQPRLTVSGASDNACALILDSQNHTFGSNLGEPLLHPPTCWETQKPSKTALTWQGHGTRSSDTHSMLS